MCISDDPGCFESHREKKSSVGCSQRFCFIVKYKFMHSICILISSNSIISSIMGYNDRCVLPI